MDGYLGDDECTALLERVDAIREAFEPFRIALEKNETDTIGRLAKDDEHLFEMSGSWTSSSVVTIGDLRRLAKVISCDGSK